MGRFLADIWPRKIVIRHTESPRENLYIVYLIQNLPRNPKMVLDFFKNLIFNSYDVILTQILIFFVSIEGRREYFPDVQGGPKKMSKSNFFINAEIIVH